MELYKKKYDVILSKYEDNYYAIFEGEVYTLNEVGARILDLCNGKNTILEISKKLAQKYSCELEQVTSDVTDYISLLEQNNLLVHL